MKVKYLLALLMLLLPLNLYASAPTATITVHITDEKGIPVEGAMVSGGFSNLMRGYKQDSEAASATDIDGKAEISGPAYFSVFVSIKKEGFYTSAKKIVLNQKKEKNITFILRKKRNPIAMYAKKIELVVPTRGKKYGFDLLKGGFVMEGHKGSHSDIFIRFDRNIVDNNYSSQFMTLNFSSETDGISKALGNKKRKTSVFKSGYFAPIDGYINQLKIINERKPNGYVRKNMNIPFYVRIRSSVNNEGKLEEAIYCKIWPGIKLVGVRLEQPILKMTYYCNPSLNDRNVEFDPKQNLFTNLKHLEKVGAP